MRTIVSAVAIGLTCCTMTSAADVITIAGTGERASTGDGGPAVDAGVAEPYGLVVGPDGALYVCEIAGHVIRRIDLQDGTIGTVVGTRESGNDGDGGPALEARIDQPYEIRFDMDGNLYFVDMTSSVVRRVDAETQNITTIAGNGTSGFSGDGGPAVEAQLKQPHSICLDNDGHLYICDIGNHRVRIVDLEAGTIDTFAGTGERGPTPHGAPLAGTPLNGPRALDFEPGNLYFALREGNAVYSISLSTHKYRHLVGTGEKGYSDHTLDARHAQLSGPKGIAVTPTGDIVIADTESHTVRMMIVDGQLSTVVGDGTQGDGPDGDPATCRLARPHGVCIGPDRTIYIGDSENHRVRALRLDP